MLQQIQNGLADAINMVITFVPRLLAFLVVLFVGWLVAKAIEKAMDAILERVGFDRAVERGGIKKALARSRYDASSLMSRLVYYVVMLFVLQLSFGVWGPNPVSTMLDRVVAYLPNVFAAALIVVVGAAIAAAVRELISAATGQLSYGKMLASAAGIAILVVAGFAALDQLNIAPAIVTGLFYAVLAVFVGVMVVALGGAGIQPLRQYWTMALQRVSAEAPALQMAAQQAPQAAKQRAQERMQQGREMASGGSSGRTEVRGGSGQGSQQSGMQGGQPGSQSAQQQRGQQQQRSQQQRGQQEQMPDYTAHRGTGPAERK